MKLFLLDTATGVNSLAVAADGKLLAAEEFAGGASTAARLIPAFDRILAAAGLTAAELDGLAVTVGPGAFTGLRVGISFIKGVAYALGKPVVALSSLELLAQNVKTSRVPVCPMLDARKQEIYTALYDFRQGGKVLLPDRAAAPADFLAGLAGDVLFLGDGALRYRPLIEEALGSRARFAADDQHQPSAASGIALATELFNAGRKVDPVSLLPAYHRLSEAEINLSLVKSPRIC